MVFTDEVVLVTGGAGFIGSHVVETLLDRGHSVIVIDNLSMGKIENLAECRQNPRFHLIQANIVDGIFHILSSFDRWDKPISRIIHLAGQTSLTASITNPFEDLRVNYGATAHVLEYARSVGAKKVVFASSAAVYGDLISLPACESMPPAPLAPYGINKLTSEYYLDYYYRVQGVPTSCLRFFNVFGPRQDPRNPYSGVISKFISQSLMDQDLLIFGDGLQTRDFVFVGDIARGVVDCCFSENTGQAEKMNLGQGMETSVQDLALQILNLTGSSSRILHLPSRSGEIIHSRADIRLAQEKFGFHCETTLTDGLAATVSWTRSQLPSVSARDSSHVQPGLRIGKRAGAMRAEATAI